MNYSEKQKYLIDYYRKNNPICVNLTDQEVFDGIVWDLIENLYDKINYFERQKAEDNIE